MSRKRNKACCYCQSKKCYWYRSIKKYVCQKERCRKRKKEDEDYYEDMRYADPNDNYCGGY